MKHLNLIFNLLLLPFLFLGRVCFGLMSSDLPYAFPSKTIRTRKNVSILARKILLIPLSIFISTQLLSAASISVKVNDDAEQEVGNNKAVLTSSDLELAYDGHAQIVGIRFTNVSIPDGATITNAYIKFQAKSSHSTTVNLNIFGENSADSAAFENKTKNISNRSKTSAIPWNNVESWTAEELYNTPPLTSIVQSIIDIPAWTSGDPITFIIEQNGDNNGEKRRAYSNKDTSKDEPELFIEYTYCNGCDCSLDDDNVNNTSPGVIIPELNGATTDITKCISGSSDDNDDDNKEDYYNFTVQTAGTLDIETLSTNNEDFHFRVWKNGSEWYPDNTAQDHNVPTMTLSAGEQVIVYFKETGGELDEYQATFTFTKLVTGTPPTFTGPIADQSGDTGVAYSLDVSTYFGETESDPITYVTSSTLPPGITLSSAGTLSGTPTTPDTYTNIVITATDKDGSTYSNGFTFTVSGTIISLPPVMGDIPDQTATLNVSFSLDISSFVTLTNADPITQYTLTGPLPAGLTFNTTTGVISGIPTAIGSSPYSLSATATDKDGESNSDDFTLTVNETIDIVSGDRPFTIRNPDSTRNITGNYAIVGNSNECAINSTNGNAPWTGDCYNSFSNSRPARYIDVDGDSSTVNSSTSSLDIPTDSKVVWAGLYWQGVIHNSNKNGDFMGESGVADGQTISGEPEYSTNTQIDFSNSSSTFGAENVKFKLKDGSYINVTADQFDFYKLGYSGFKDVTSMLDVNNPNGVYTLADIKSHQGIESRHGNYAAWSLVVIYENPHEHFRNITLFDGYVTVDSSYSEDLVMSGFLTPRVGPINSKLAMFAMDGDNGTNSLTIINEAGESTNVPNQDNPSHSLFDSTISNSITRNPDESSLRTDLKVLDLVDVLNPLETSATLRPRSSGDRYTPSFFIMSAELIQPDICYDYAYQQNGRYFTEENDGSNDPRIIGSLFSDSPITVSVYVKNREDSDFTITNLTTSIRNIDVSQAPYLDGTTEITLPGQIARTPVDPQSSSPSFIEGVPIGVLGGEEGFYLYYDLDPQTYDINMPLDTYLDYDATFTLPNGTNINLPPYLNQKLTSDIPLCIDGNFSYAPVHTIFNVEEKNLGKYNIYTQVARRVDDFEVKAYDINSTDTPVDVSSIVAIELIDAGAYHETETSCQEPDSALTPRVWVTFDNNVSSIDFTWDTLDAAITDGSISDQILGQSTPIDEPEDFYTEIRRNTAFRVSYTRVGTGSLLQTENVYCSNNPSAGATKDCYNVLNFPDLVQTDLGGGYGQGKCFQDLGNPNTIPNHCSNAGGSNASSMTKAELAECMECLYGYDLHYVCSRDNFAIRPEAFKVSLNDDNTSTVHPDFANNTDKSGSVGIPVNLSAGYPYGFDINATSHTDENPVKGYVQSFDSSDPRKRAYMAWNPQIITSVQADANCNAPEDRNMTFYLIDGTNTNPNPLNTWEDNHDRLANVGEYEFKVVDEEWTKYDWEENLTLHHNTGNYFSNATPDCIPGDNTVPDVVSKVGCETSSVHGTTYKAVNIRSHPYSFKVSDLSIGARPSNDITNNAFIYINTLLESLYPGGVDENMSYNVQGSFMADSYTDTDYPLTNFVNNCYAEDVNMELLYSYNFTAPADSLTYDLFDYNITGYTRVNNTLPSNNIILQGKGNFSKVMEGSIIMDLGYNYPRTYNTAINPIPVSMNDFNISYTTQPSSLFVEGKSDHEIFGNRDIDTNVTFVYGRAKPSQDFYDDVTANNINTPISIVVYCDQDPITCSAVYNIETVLSKTDEFDWYLSRGHIMTPDNDGDITLNATNGGTVTSPVIINNSGGVDANIIVGDGGQDHPLDVNIDFGTNTNRWLIYNKSLDAIPSPFYRVRFIGQSDWAGHGDTGHVVGSNSSSKKNRRLGW